MDFSGFFIGDNILFGVFFVIVLFGGIPFLTAFSYVLLAGEIMEFSMDDNIQRFYGIMEKEGYDIKPRKLFNMLEGYSLPRKEFSKKTEKE